MKISLRFRSLGSQASRLCLLLFVSMLSFTGIAQAADGASAFIDQPQSTTVSYQVASLSDDVNQDGAAIYPFNTSLTLGDDGVIDHHNGVRFTGVNIPHGAVITEAHLDFTAWTDTSGAATILIRGHDTGNSPTFSLTDGPMNRLTQANTPIVTWSPVDWVSEGVYTTPNLAPILGQIISRPDWSPGNAITLLLSDGDGISGGERKAYSFGRDPSKAPRLYVTYEAPSLTGIVNPGMFAGAANPAAQAKPDLALTSVTTNQNGYRAESNYEITVEVTNVGLLPADGVQVEVTIERATLGTGYLGIGPVQGGAVVPITMNAQINLGPGESVVLQSGSRPLDLDVLVEAGLGEWVPGIPNHSDVYARARVLPALVETNLLNNEALTSFTFPTGPADPDYDPSNDSDLDGWEDADEGTSCSVHPDSYPGGVDTPGDGEDGDCAGGDIPLGWALTGDPAQGIADNPAPDSDSDGDGYSANQGDCWEGPNPPGEIAYPGAADIPDGYDNDCDGEIDEDYSLDLNASDLDGDGISVAQGDCDDLNGSIRPGASELADGIDNNCNGFIDEGHLTPDWAITDFQVIPQDSECVRFTHVELWNDETQCGLQFELEIQNVGEDLGPLALEVVRNSAYVTDLVRDYGIPPSGSILYPYTIWQPWPLIELMACGPMGFIAVIPAASGEGQLGESNLLNNLSIAYLPTYEQDIDITFASNPLSAIEYPQPFLMEAYDVLDRLSIIPSAQIEGTCPTPDLIDFWIQVRVYQNENLIFEHTDFQLDSEAFGVNDSQTPFATNLNSRPANGDVIRIEILLNSDGMVSETDTTNNLCVLEFEYDRAGFGRSRANDRLLLLNSPECPVSIDSGGEQTTIGATDGALIGGSPIRLSGLLLGAIGALLGWRFMAGAGRSIAGILAGVGAGAIAGGALGALGALAVTQLMGPAARAPGSPPTSGRVPSEIPIHQSIDQIGEQWNQDPPPACSELLNPKTEFSMDSEGNLEDILLSWDGGGASPQDRLAITVWNSSASPAVFFPDTPPFSLSQAGLLDAVGEHLVWQIALEETLGGDLYLSRCLPSLQQLSLSGIRLAQQAMELIGDALIFGGCDPDDPDCHVWARLEFQNGQPILALDVSVQEALLDENQAFDLRFQSAVSFAQEGNLVAGPLSQLVSIGQLVPEGEVIIGDGVPYVPFTLRSKIPSNLSGIISVDGTLQLTLGRDGIALAEIPIMGEALDLTPPPTPTPTPIPTPTPTPIPDNTGPKVGGISDNPDPIFTSGNNPDTSFISANVSDPSGVASVTLYYRVGSKGSYQVWGAMSGSGGNFSSSFGPFGSAGIYEYRIYAVDNLGNTNCTKESVSSCPGSTLTVTIP